MYLSTCVCVCVCVCVWEIWQVSVSATQSSSFPERVKIVEVGPRDGLQNEKVKRFRNSELTRINTQHDSYFYLFFYLNPNPVIEWWTSCGNHVKWNTRAVSFLLITNSASIRPSFQQRWRSVWLICSQRQDFLSLRPQVLFHLNGSLRWDAAYAIKACKHFINKHNTIYNSQHKIKHYKKRELWEIGCIWLTDGWSRGSDAWPPQETWRELPCSDP